MILCFAALPTRGVRIGRTMPRMCEWIHLAGGVAVTMHVGIGTASGRTVLALVWMTMTVFVLAHVALPESIDGTYCRPSPRGKVNTWRSFFRKRGAFASRAGRGENEHSRSPTGGAQ